MQNGFTLIETDSSGRASHSTNTSSGSLSTLSPGGAAYSPFVSGAACIFVGFSSNFSTVDALLVTKSNLQTMLSGVRHISTTLAPFSACHAAFSHVLIDPDTYKL